MDRGLTSEYERIGAERDHAGRLADRERFWFFVRLAGICWLWVIVGGLMLAQGFHINATVGQFYFPGLMAKAEAWLKGGLFVGTAGPLATLIQQGADLIDLPADPRQLGVVSHAHHVHAEPLQQAQAGEVVHAGEGEQLPPRRLCRLRVAKVHLVQRCQAVDGVLPP